MLYYLDYIIYIIYSFLMLLVLYLLILIYKKYSFMVFDILDKEIIISDKYSEKKKYQKILPSQSPSPSPSNTIKKIKKLKKQYKIKSTEKTYEDIKFISNKPNYINLHTNTNTNTNTNIFISTINIKKIKNYENDKNVKKISNDYLKTKQEFFNLFVDSENGKYYINGLNEFELFHKNSMISNDYLNSNILIKFYNDSTSKTHIYMFVNQNKMIKIINDKEYDNICDMIEKNNGIFILEDINKINTYVIGYGSYTQSNLNLSDIKKIFFSNIPNYKSNKNYKILSEFSCVKIYFYICNEIILEN